MSADRDAADIIGYDGASYTNRKPIDGRQPAASSGARAVAVCEALVDTGAPLNVHLPYCDECWARTAQIPSHERRHGYWRAVSDDWDATGRMHFVTYTAMRRADKRAVITDRETN